MSNQGNVPLIHVTVEQMKYTIAAALSEHCAQLDAQMQEALNAALKPERLKELLGKVAKREIDAAIDKAVSDFYRYGKGRDVIKELVTDELNGKFEDQD
jgi:ribosomal protein S3AE